MTVLASIRPDSWNFPLFLHVLGAMILVGGTLAGDVLAGTRASRIGKGRHGVLRVLTVRSQELGARRKGDHEVHDSL